MTKRVNILLILFLVFYSNNCWSQSSVPNINIRGQVIGQEAKEPVSSVIIKIDSSVFKTNEFGEFNLSIDSLKSRIISFHTLGYRELKFINIYADESNIDLIKIPMFTSRLELISYPPWMPFKYQVWRTKRSEIRLRKKSNKEIAEMSFIYNNKELKFQTSRKKDEIIVDLLGATKHNMR